MPHCEAKSGGGPGDEVEVGISSIAFVRHIHAFGGPFGLTPARAAQMVVPACHQHHQSLAEAAPRRILEALEGILEPFVAPEVL